MYVYEKIYNRQITGINIYKVNIKMNIFDCIIFRKK